MSSNWPTSLDTDAGLYVAVNELQNTLNGAINNSVTTITLTSTTGFPAAGTVLIDNEVIYYGGVSGANLTSCVRAFDGTTAASHSNGAVVSFAIIADHHNALKNAVEAVESDLQNRFGYGNATPANSRITPINTSANQFLATDSSDHLEGISVTASRAVVTDTNGLPTASSVTSTQLAAFLNLLAYRRPVLSFISTTVVGVETGVDGTSGDATILFPDGSFRTDSTTTRIRMTISQNAVFNNATRANNQGGLDTGSVSNDTWYAVYAVKVTAGSGSATDFVLVASLNTPVQASYATLNSNFGTNGWVYLGMIRYGDGGSTHNAILDFVQTGHMTLFRNAVVGNAFNAFGILMVSATTSWTNLVYTYASGTGQVQIPGHLGLAYFSGSFTGGSVSGTGEFNIFTSANTSNYLHSWPFTGNGRSMVKIWVPAKDGFQIQWNAAGTQPTKGDIFLVGFTDGVLGVGPNPVL